MDEKPAGREDAEGKLREVSENARGVQERSLAGDHSYFLFYFILFYFFFGSSDPWENFCECGHLVS